MTDKLREAAQKAPMAYYALVIKADSGYESTTEGRCTADQYGAAMAALHGTAALAQQDAQTWAHLPKGCTHYTRTGDERVTLHFESEASADAWHDAQAASPTPPTQQDAQCGLCGADRPFTGSCGGGRENPRALCFADRVPLAQQDAQAVRQGEAIVEEFSAWLNERRGMSVAWVFHDVVAKFRAMLNAAPTPPAQQDAKAAVRGWIPPSGLKIADIGFRWDSDALQHVPHVLVEFEPVPANLPNTEKGWADRDAFVEMLNAAPTPPAQAVLQEPCAVVKWQTGGPVVHIIGEVQVGDLLYRAAPTPPAQQDAREEPK